jgi:hypothetical protein
MTVGELKEALATFPDDANVEIMATREWRVYLQGVAADRIENGRFRRVLLLSSSAATLSTKQKECTCVFPTYYYSPEGAKGHCTCGAL